MGAKGVLKGRKVDFSLQSPLVGPGDSLRQLADNPSSTSCLAIVTRDCLVESLAESDERRVLYSSSGKGGDGDGKVTEARGELVADAVVWGGLDTLGAVTVDAKDEAESFLSEDCAVVIVEIHIKVTSPEKTVSI